MCFVKKIRRYDPRILRIARIKMTLFFKSIRSLLDIEFRTYSKKEKALKILVVLRTTYTIGTSSLEKISMKHMSINMVSYYIGLCE